MIVLVPISRFLVRYEVARGLPFSKLDRLVLTCIEQGTASLQTLDSVFQIHRRLLIQSLVTLTHAGWVAMGQSAETQFVITEEGKRALEKEQLPPSIEISRRQTYVLMERVTGIVIPEDEAQYVSKKHLVNKDLWNQCVRLRSEVDENRLDESQVHHLLPRDQGQRLHWIGPIYMVTKDDHYIPVDVDIENETITNLPERSYAILRTYILDKAKEGAAERERAGQDLVSWDDFRSTVQVGRSWSSIEETELSGREWSARYAPDDLLAQVEDHQRLLDHALREAKTSLLILSSIIEQAGLERIRSLLHEALRRGVDVDILWKEEEGHMVNWLKKLVYEMKTSGATGHLRFNRDPSTSNAKLLIWDREENRFMAAVGGYDWLSSNAVLSPTKANNFVFGLCVSHPALVADLCWCAAAHWGQVSSEALSSVPNKWKQIAGLLEIQATEIVELGDTGRPDSIKVRVTVNREHAVLIHELAKESQVRFLIASLGFEDGAYENLSQIVHNLCEREITPQIIYGAIPGKEDLIINEVSPDRHQISNYLQKVSGLKTNMIISDNSICFGSFNFLSSPLPKDKAPRELGLLIEGVQFADEILHKMTDVTRNISTNGDSTL